MFKSFTFTLLSAILLSTSMTFAQSTTLSFKEFATPIAKSKSSSLLANTPFANSQAITINKQVLENTFMTSKSKVLLTGMPVATNQLADLELIPEPYPVMDGRTKIRVSTKQGWKTIAVPHMTSYRGTIIGEPDSRALVVYADGEMYASIHRADGNFTQIVPQIQTAKSPNSLTHFVTDSKTVPEGSMNFHCKSELIKDNYRFTETDVIASGKTKGAPALQNTVFKEAVIALETDRFLYTRMGRDEARIARYMFALFTQVSMIYQLETNIGIILGDVIIHTTESPDPYTQNITGDIGALLGEMRDFWASNMGEIQRDIAHLITGPGSTDVGGIAYRETLCSRQMGYSVSGIRGNFSLPMLAYNWDCFVVAHELGHNFSARHTHDCFWGPPIDTCVSRTGSLAIGDACFAITPRYNPGSIMSYCHLAGPTVRYTFLNRVADVIRNGADRASCIQQPPSPKITITYPIGYSDMRLTADTVLNVLWASARVSNVNVQYSTNNGRTWEAIRMNMPAADGSTQWTVPRVTTDSALVRISSTTDATVADTSFIPFKIINPGITITSPGANARIPRNRSYTIGWQANAVNAVNIQFSSGAGQPYTTIRNNATGNNFSWTTPDIQATGCRIKITASNNPNLFAESEPFDIGTPVLKLSSSMNIPDSVCVSTNFVIKWESDFVESVRLQVSTNNGRNFPFGNNINLNIPGNLGEFTWNVPSRVVSDSVRIRIADNNLQSFADTTVMFRITTCVVSSVNDLRGESTLEIAGVYPNPVNDKVYVTMNMMSAQTPVEFALISVRGERIELGSRYLTVGSSVTELSTQAIPQGKYVLVAISNGVQASIPIVIVR
jgi:hypothetical protein